MDSIYLWAVRKNKHQKVPFTGRNSYSKRSGSKSSRCRRKFRCSEQVLGTAYYTGAYAPTAESGLGGSSAEPTSHSQCRKGRKKKNRLHSDAVMGYTRVLNIRCATPNCKCIPKYTYDIAYFLIDLFVNQDPRVIHNNPTPVDNSHPISARRFWACACDLGRLPSDVHHYAVS